MKNVTNSGAEMFVTKNASEVFDGGVTVARLAVVEELADVAENIFALRFINGQPLCGGDRFTLTPFGFDIGLLVLGLRSGRGPRGLYAKGGDSEDPSSTSTVEETEAATIRISSCVRANTEKKS